MDVQQFLIFNVVCIIVFTIWFVLGRRSSKKDPTTLNLNSGDSSSQNQLEAPQEPIHIDLRFPLDPEAAKNLAAQAYHKQSPQNRSKQNNDSKTSNSDSDSSTAQDDTHGSGHEIPHEKSLNVFFIFNGHDWDAYKVLGIPANSNFETVQSAYQKAVREVDKDTLAFLETAYNAILENYRRTKKAH